MPSLAQCLKKAGVRITQFDRSTMIEQANLLRERGYTDDEAHETVVREMIGELERERTELLRQAEESRMEIDKINQRAWKKAQPGMGETVIRVDPRRLMSAYLNQDDTFSRQIQAEVDQMNEGLTGRTAKVDTMLRAGGKLEPAQVFSETAPGRIDFQDGRHRVLWAALNAVDSIPIITSYQSLKALKPYTLDSVEADTAKTSKSSKQMRAEQMDVLGTEIPNFVAELESSENAPVDAETIYGGVADLNPGVRKETIDQWLVDRAENFGDIELVQYPEGSVDIDPAVSIMDGATAYQSVIRTKTAEYGPKNLMDELMKPESMDSIIEYLDSIPNDRYLELAHEMGRLGVENLNFLNFMDRQLQRITDQLSEARQNNNYAEERRLEQEQRVYEEATNFAYGVKNNKKSPAYFVAQDYKQGRRPVTDRNLRRAVLGEEYQRDTYTPGNVGITIEQVQEIFPGQEVRIDEDGNIAVKVRSGRGVVIKNVDVIDVDRIALNAAYGRMGAKNKMVIGKYHEGVIELRKDRAGKWVLAHESYHWMEDAGIVTVQDADILTAEIQRLHSKGKFDPVNPDEIGGAEDRANFVAANLEKRQEYRGPVRKILTRIADWIDKFINLFARTSRAVIRDISTGNIYGNVRGAEGVAEFPLYQAAAWHGTGAFFKKFLSKFIGTGEGVQAFGWGLYFTAVKNIGRYYADTLGKTGTKLTDDKGRDVFEFLEGKKNKEVRKELARIFDAELIREDRRANEINRTVQYLREWANDLRRIRQAYAKIVAKRKQDPNYDPFTDPLWETANKYSPKETEQRIKDFEYQAGVLENIGKMYEQGKIIAEPIKGRNLYNVTLWKGLVEGKDYFLLDYYGNITPEQWQKIKKQAYEEIAYFQVVDPNKPKDYQIGWMESLVEDGIEAGDLYDILERIMGGAKRASQFLNRAGFAGIRYPAGTITAWVPEGLAEARSEFREKAFNVGTPDPKMIRQINGYVNEGYYDAAQDMFEQTIPDAPGKAAARKALNKYIDIFKNRPVNYVVFDENDISIDQVEQYQAIKQPPEPQPKPPPPQYMAKTEEQKEFEATQPNKKQAKELGEQWPAAIRWAYKFVGDIFRNRNEGWKDARPDTNVWDRIFSLPTHYFAKVPALAKVLAAALKRHDVYYNLTKHIEDMPGGASFLAKFEEFKKKNKKLYRKINSYLFRTDLMRKGFGVQSYKKGLDTVWGVIDRDGNKMGIEFYSGSPELNALNAERRADGLEPVDSENAAVSAMIAAEGKYLVEQRGFTPEMAQIVGYFRMTTNNGFNILMQNIRNMRLRYQKAGRPLPQVAYFDQAEKIMVDLNVALAKMGDLRGTYFPRIRKPGRYTLYAIKDGTQNILRHFDSKRVMNYYYNKYSRQGYKVERNYSSKLPEDVFEMGGAIINLQAQINAAFERAQKQYEEGMAAKIDEAQLEAQAEATMREMMPEIELQFASAIAEQVANNIKARGVRAHMIGRNEAVGDDVWAGYEEDALTALGLYVRGVAAGEAKRRMSVEMMRGFTGTDIAWSTFKADYEMYMPGLQADIDKEFEAGKRKNRQVMYKDYMKFVDKRRVSQRSQGNAYRDGTQYMLDMLRNDEAADRFMGQIRGIATLKYLAGRVAAPFVNLTALPTSTVAAMNGMQNIPINKAFRYIGRGMNTYRIYTFGKKNEMAEWDRKIIDYIISQGWHEAQYNAEALNVLRSMVGRGWDRLINVSMYMFGASEKINRTSTIAGTFMAIRDKNIKQWEAADADGKQALMEQWGQEAKEVSDAAHGVYGKENRPSWARGSHAGARLAQSFYVFKTFSHNYLLTMKRFGFKNPKATLWMVASPALLAGAGASVATPLIAVMLRALGIGGEDPEEEFYKFIEENLGTTAGTTARDGLFGSTLGIATKGSLAIGVTDLPTSIADFLGAPYSMGEDIVKGFQQIGRGNELKALEKFLPNFMAAPVKGVREWKQGVTTETNTPYFYGTEPIKASLTEAIVRAASFNPARIAAIREKQFKERKVEDRLRNVKRDINAQLKAYMLKRPQERTPEDYLEILKKMQEFNERLRQSGVPWLAPFTAANIRSTIQRAFRPSKKERMREQMLKRRE